MSTLITKLREGSIYAPKRWSGDTGNYSPVDEKATDELLVQAADEIDKLERELAAAREDITKLIAATEDLLDEQNGVPLLTREEQYNAAVANARAAIDAAKKGTS